MRKSSVLMGIVVSGILLCAGLIATLIATGITGSATGTLASGRTITTTANSLALEIAFGNDTATIRTYGDQIVVTPDAIYHNERLWGVLDPAVKIVEITVDSRGLRVAADGNPVTAIPTTVEK